MSAPDPLSPAHRAYLNAHAISDEVLASAQVFSLGDEIVFPWKDGDQLTAQRRMWPEPEGGLPDGWPKYTWERDRPLHLAAWRLAGPDAPDGPVIIAEGTKQSLAVASWAPPEYAVFGMAGCWGWSHDGRPVTDLARFAGRPVFLLLDADAGENLNVWEAGEKLAQLLELEDAVPGFVPSPAWGKGGIDDYLAGIPEERRTERLARLLAKGQSKPADRKPAHRKVTETLPDTGGRPLVVVNRDRMLVIRDILGHLMSRWSGTDLFCYGGVLTRLRAAATEPLDPGAFARWLAEGAYTAKYTPAGVASPGRYEAAWPDQMTMSALLSSGDEFAPLKRVSRTPFIRPDGTVCAKNGYDQATQTVLVTGNSGMDRLDIPDAPSRDEAAAAARFLLDEWLGDFCWRDESSRASALALVLTPFTRGLVPLVPLAVISGLQPGVGKGLLADCIQLMIAGEASPPLPWLPDDDDENRKQITSAFRGGASVMWFDEAHRIDSAALSRAITSLTYADRILGVSKMAAFPNQVTWLATGNQVAVSADMARRAHWIEIYPDMPDPDTRPEEDFTHPGLREWTTASRPELITAALTVIRAWFAAGQPAYPRGTLMGSFEGWDRMMSGILGYAGVEGFLSGLAGRRAERDMAGGYWAEHLAWLHGHFRGAEFTVLDVRTRAMASGGTWDSPPRLDDPDDKGFARSLGAAYSGVASRWFGPHRLVKVGIGHRKVQKWCVETREGSDPATPPAPPAAPAPEGGPPAAPAIPPQIFPPTVPVIPPYPSIPPSGQMPLDLGGRDQEGSPPRACARARETEAFSADRPPADAEGGRMLGDMPPAVGFSGVHPLRAGREGWRDWEGSSLPRYSAQAQARALTGTREGGGSGDPSQSLHPSAGPVLGFDLEGAWANQLFTRERGYVMADGTGFVRLCGITGPSGQNAIVPVGDLVAMIGAAGLVYGHNIMGFDGPALAWHHGLDWRAFCAKARDTELIARQAFPPRSREHGSADKLGLDAVAALLGLPGKTDDFKRLARKHGGADKIPLDDPEYRAYLNGDLDATRGVAGHLLRHYDGDSYLPREHKLAAIAGQITLNGFAVDAPLLEQRLAEGAERKAQALELLHAGWGLPLGRTVLRGRGAARHEEEQEFDSPLATGEGRAWLESMWQRYQVPDPPRTGTGLLAIGEDDLKPVAFRPGCPEGLRAMIQLMCIVTGTRTIYQTITDYLGPDGRVHPKISFRQASGRWSFTEPGLTVLGKHDGRHRERDVLVADPGHALFTCDLSQVDMRAIAGHCQDPAYMELFAPGRDAHSEIAAMVLGDPHGGHCPKGCKLRQGAKARGHGWNYGLGPKRMIAEGADPQMVWDYVNGMAARFPVLCAWREEIRAMGKAGMVLDNGFGRRMMADPQRAYTVAPALMGQGGARDIMGDRLLALPRELDPFLRGMIHDDVVLSVPAGDAEEIRHLVQQVMTSEWRGVPILCDLSRTGRSWGEISAE